MPSIPRRSTPPGDALRHIAVYVTEPEAGWFSWILVERHVDDWAELEIAEEWVASYRGAMAEGLLALQGLVDDLDRGPRETGTAAPHPAPAPSSPRRSAPTDSPSPAAPAGHFGFGDLA